MKFPGGSITDKYKISAVMLTSFLAVTAGALIPQVNIVSWNLGEAILILAVAFLSSVPFLHNIYTGSFDIFEPVYMICLTTFISFVIIPIWLLLDWSSSLEVANYRAELTWAITLSGLGLLGFYFGYYVSLGRWQSNQAGQFGDWLGRSLDRASAYRWSWVGLLTAIFIFIAWLRIGDVPLSALNVLASDTRYGAAKNIADQNSIAYLFSIHVSWPALWLLVYAYRPPGKATIVFLFIWGLMLTIYVASGGRGITLQLLVATVIYLYLTKAKRPSLQAVLIFLISFFFLAGMLVSLRRQYNTNISQLIKEQTFAGSERDLTTGGAVTGMMILLHVFPDKVGFLTGDIFKPLLYAPIPRIVWPDKPPARAILTVAEQFVPRAHAPPFFGPFYAGFGTLGVAVSMALFGVVSAWIYSLWQQQPNSGIARILLAIWVGFLWALYHRGGIVWIVVNTTYTMGPIFLVAILAKSRILTKPE